MFLFLKDTFNLKKHWQKNVKFCILFRNKLKKKILTDIYNWMIKFTHKCCMFQTPHDVLHNSTSAPCDTILTSKRSEHTVSQKELIVKLQASNLDGPQQNWLRKMSISRRFLIWSKLLSRLQYIHIHQY